MTERGLERVLRRDRAVLLAAIAAIAILAWAHIIWSAAAAPGGAVGGMAGHAMGPGLEPWSIADFVAMLAMWAVMMVGMMTPSAAPMILIYARVGRKAAQGGTPFAPAGWFASG